MVGADPLASGGRRALVAVVGEDDLHRRLSLGLVLWIARTGRQNGSAGKMEVP